MSGMPPSCACCGKNERKAEVTPVPVKNQHNGEHFDLPLCAGCRASNSATWRLRFQPASDHDQAPDITRPPRRVRRLQHSAA